MLSIVEIVANILGATGTIIALFAFAYQIKKDRTYSTEKQARNVAAWVESDMTARGTTIIFISNMSDLPIFEVIVTRDMVFEGGSTERMKDGYFAFIQSVPPGMYKVEIESDGGAMNHKFNASITFRDAGGRYWDRDAAGFLHSIHNNGIDYRGLDRPVSCSSIERLG